MPWEFKEEKKKQDWNCIGEGEEELHLRPYSSLRNTGNLLMKMLPLSQYSGTFQELKEDRVLDKVK